MVYWFQRVKDKEFESNSQLLEVVFAAFETGFSVSKIKNLKAIHNKNEETRKRIELVSACQR